MQQGQGGFSDQQKTIILSEIMFFSKEDQEKVLRYVTQWLYGPVVSQLDAFYRLSDRELSMMIKLSIYFVRFYDDLVVLLDNIYKINNHDLLLLEWESTHCKVDLFYDRVRLMLREYRPNRTVSYILNPIRMSLTCNDHSSTEYAAFFRHFLNFDRLIKEQAVTIYGC
ncbi:hypothetical protein DID73_00485 [Candidatus Marinamargulisbacteria bacterium SCGC AG-343-K17]|nr:hypothetical protein DID73_00485 [Candidatus Marinamargulisbacteria bacterium SCGC AG-343-K17]